MSKPHVPKFGNWDASDHIPFTVVFENARTGMGTGIGKKIINPNDPSENPAAFGIRPDNLPPPPARYAAGPRVDPANGKPDANTNPSGPNTVDVSRNGSRESEDEEQSPSHQNADKGHLHGSLPVGQEKKMSHEGGKAYQSTNPSQSRIRPFVRGEERPTRNSAVPRFGTLNSQGPAHNEKKVGGPVRIPVLQRESTRKADFGATTMKPAHRLRFLASRKASVWTCCFQAGDAV